MQSVHIRMDKTLITAGYVVVFGIGVTIGTLDPRKPTPKQVADTEIAAKFNCSMAGGRLTLAPIIKTEEEEK
jgi:hypothetical protein